MSSLELKNSKFANFLDNFVTLVFDFLLLLQYFHKNFPHCFP